MYNNNGKKKTFIKNLGHSCLRDNMAKGYLCNLSPCPGIVSWTVSPSMPLSVRPPLQWNNTTEEVVKLRGAITARGELTLIPSSCVRDCRRHTVFSTDKLLQIMLLCGNVFSYCFVNFQSREHSGLNKVHTLLVCLQLFVKVFLRTAYCWFLRDLTPGSALVFTHW